MKIKHIFGIALLAISTTISAQSINPNTKWHWEKGTIVVDTPVRPAGQQNALQMTAPKLQTVRIGFCGLGSRGPWAVNRYCHIPGVQIVALCDYEEGRAEACQRFLRKASLPPADIYSGATGYEELCKREDIDLVYVTTDWEHHFPIAKCAMENGKHVVIEVPACLNLEQCWALIDLCEKTRKHCMMLENCCYDYYELTLMNMVQQGVLGEVIRAEGAYLHTLSGTFGGYWHNPDGSDPDNLRWRLKYNSENRGDIYPTHGLGPVAQCMNIHRGDCFKTLVAMDTKSIMGAAEAQKMSGGKDFSGFRNGDHTTTLMRTEQGKVIEIQHNVMTPQPYNRLFKLTGTKGYATKYPDPKLYITKEQASNMNLSEMAGKVSGHEFLPQEEYEALMKKYYHPILAKYGELGREMGHGGVDFNMDSRLVYCLQNGLPLDMDVYDMAEWCSLAELGALSMDNGCAAVAFPDFTRGYWNVQKEFRHAYAPADEEAATEAAAKASTEKQKTMTVQKKLWEKYDKAQAKKNKNKK